MLSDERLENVERFVSESLNEDASLHKVCSPQTLTKASQRLFVSDRNWRNQRSGVRCEGDHIVLCEWSRIQAIQANCNPLLDVARETYKENVGDIKALHGNLSEKHDLPIQLVCQESGFLFSIRKGDLIEGKLPWGFTNLSMQRGRWLFTSMELVSNDLACNIIKYTWPAIAEKTKCQDERCP
jgi:DNA mismatch repair protein MSH4